MVLAWAKKAVNLVPLCGVCRRLESVLGAGEETFLDAKRRGCSTWRSRCKRLSAGAQISSLSALQRGSRFLPWCNSKSARYLYAFSSMHYLQCMDYQICLRQLERFEPVYRMQFGPEINNGWRTSVCSRCLSAFVESLKRPGLRDRFRSPKPCEVCARPVYNLKRKTVARVICSAGCRGVIDTEREKNNGEARAGLVF
jgi:hypothetical protein